MSNAWHGELNPNQTIQYETIQEPFSLMSDYYQVMGSS
jgi:hypothetical protein